MSPLPETFRCPVCKRSFVRGPTVALPFCSARCQQIDLGRWLSEGYALPENPEVDDEDVVDKMIDDEADDS